MVDWNSLHQTYMVTWLHCVTPACLCQDSNIGSYFQSGKVSLSLTNDDFTVLMDQVGLTDVLLFEF